MCYQHDRVAGCKRKREGMKSCGRDKSTHDAMSSMRPEGIISETPRSSVTPREDVRVSDPRLTTRGTGTAGVDEAH
jgi:hypothetical protein